MGRKNRRVETFTPLDLTPAEFNAAPVTREQRQAKSQRSHETGHQKAERQRQARINKGIDWSVCVVPGCGQDIRTHGSTFHIQPEGLRDASLALPICYDHAAVVWRDMVARHVDDPRFIEAIADVNERLAARNKRLHEERKAANKANVTHGDIYFVRIGGLVKVGWTRDLWGRLKSYGASAELLATYPGSRDDETNLHRQLRPALAKGREWYEDGSIIAHFIDDALARYGTPPKFTHLWTEPKQVVAGKRAARYR